MNTSTVNDKNHAPELYEVVELVLEIDSGHLDAPYSKW